ncbi:MAG: 4a-hydroxytetrahydrobiopterin dehydratase [Weeksellaceae bacterium]
MEQHSSWTEKENGLYKKFQFKDFVETFGFMTQVALLAEKAGHHPTWKNTYNTLEIWLITHDADHQITKKDRELAERIDDLL